MSTPDPIILEPTEPTVEEPADNAPVVPGPEASWAELRDVPMPALMEWAEAHPSEWEALKQSAAAPAAGAAEPSEGEGADLEGLSEEELDRLIDKTLDRIEDPAEAREVAILREGGGPDGSPSRLRALRDAAARALQSAGPDPWPDFVESSLNTVTFDPTHGERREVDAFGNVRRSPWVGSPEEAGTESKPEWTGREKLSDLIGLSHADLIRYADRFPEHWERLKIEASRVMDERQRDIRGSAGIF